MFQCAHCWHYPDGTDTYEVEDPRHGEYFRVLIRVLEQRCCKCGVYRVAEIIFGQPKERPDIAPRDRS